MTTKPQAVSQTPEDALKTKLAALLEKWREEQRVAVAIALRAEEEGRHYHAEDARDIAGIVRNHIRDLEEVLK